MLNTELSGKLVCLRAMLAKTVAAGEKAVVGAHAGSAVLSSSPLAGALRDCRDMFAVSNSTRMLDATQMLCDAAELAVGRIDGSTQPQLRQQQVDTFNRHDSDMKVTSPSSLWP